MTDEIDIFNDQYNQEIALIKANGNNKSALRIRYEQYHAHERELLAHILHKSLEQAGRKAALVNVGKEIDKVGARVIK